jgi:hypothetical protein
MATVKRYQILCAKCHHHFPVFAALSHTVSLDEWMKIGEPRLVGLRRCSRQGTRAQGGQSHQGVKER